MDAKDIMIKNKYLPIIITFFLFADYAICNAANISLPWASSFTGCSQDTYYPNDGFACGSQNTVWNNVNIGVNGPVCGSKGIQQISIEANYYGGAGERGWRRYVCNDGGASGSLILKFVTQPELWIRFYFRHSAGFSWDPLRFEKLFFLRFPGGQSVMQTWGWDSCVMWATHGYGTTHSGRKNNIYCERFGAGWDTMYAKGDTDPSTGHKISDGSWHAYELHVKMESRAGAFDGHFDLWLDGKQVAHYTNVNYSATVGYVPGWTSLQILANLYTVSVGGYVDIDDIAISNNGYIGLIVSNSNDIKKKMPDLNTKNY